MTPSGGFRTAAGFVALLRILVLMSVFRTIVEASSGFMACPTDCSCLGNMVDCSKKRLTRVPDDLPSWVQILDISSNTITHVRNDQFKGLERLEEIKLSHNLLSQIPVVVWPSNLSHIHLSHNVISHVNASSFFRNMENLRVIDLSFNSIAQLKNRTFSALRNLHHLFLTDNKIESIDRGAFENLSSLEWLKLNKNQLTSLPPNVFLRLQKLKNLELNQNRLKKIEGLRFQGLGNLLSLRLRRNSLSELMDGSFWGLSSLQTLQMDYNNLSKINSGFLFGLETMEQLFISHNVISQIEPDSWTSCKRLSELDLSHNHLSAISDNAFTKLESLQILRLSHNRISYISENAFHDLVALKTLDLNHNKLSSTLEDASSVFSSLSSLTRLSLDGNDIKSIAKHTFTGLHELKHLNLLDNSITSVQENAFQPLVSLEQMKFNSTSLLCDCLLSWLPVWLRETGFQVNVHAHCAHPEAIQGQNILQVNGSNFKCDDFPKPVILKDPLSQIALKDGTLNLTCTSATSSNSQLKIDWKKDHMILNSALVENTARVGKDGLVEFTSLLLLRPVKNEHAGSYQCVVSNALGTTYSAKAEITVGVFPRFVKMPSNVTVKAGSTARLECAALGQPTPEIAWQKDGGDDFPAARERRMHVMPSDDVFFIVEVKSEDQGVYTCTAKNDAGFVKANLTLTVLETPSFAKTAREKVAMEGETTVLECMSSRHGGRPRLEWLKEGRPLVVTSRHFFAADGQLLIIIKTQSSDSGEYTCIMTNSLGSERATSYFTVISASLSNYDGNAARNNNTDDMTRVGIIVIAVVFCVVGTSLVWVIVIYRLRLKREEYGSTTTDETTLPGDLPSSPFHATEEGSSVTERPSSPVLWNNTKYKVSSNGSYVGRSMKKVLNDSNEKHSPIQNCYLYNSCQCQDSGCFCTDPRVNRKLSSPHLPIKDGSSSYDILEKHRLPTKDSHSRSVASTPNLNANSNRPVFYLDLCRSLQFLRPTTKALGRNVDQTELVHDACSGWQTISDNDLSYGVNYRSCKDSCCASCQKGQTDPTRCSCLQETDEKSQPSCSSKSCPHKLVVVSNQSCHSDVLHEPLATVLPQPGSL